MVALGFLFMGVLKYAALSKLWHQIVIGVTIFLVIGGLLLQRFAYLWDCFLDRPDPKGPPSLFK